MRPVLSKFGALRPEGDHRDDDADQEVGGTDAEQGFQRVAKLGLPKCRSAPYAPQDNTAPATKMIQPIRLFLGVSAIVCMKSSVR